MNDKTSTKQPGRAADDKPMQPVRESAGRGQSGSLCGQIMVGSGTDTYDPICELPEGHGGSCKSTAAIDQHRLRPPTVEPFLCPDETASEMGIVGYVAWESAPTLDAAIALAWHENGPGDGSLAAKLVLLREESEIEARINGHEFPLWVECTKRARRPVPYWKVERDG